ncbi:Aminomethyltransferase, partial [Pseudomonas coronafaciens pv. coronafaciens]
MSTTCLATAIWSAPARPSRVIRKLDRPAARSNPSCLIHGPEKRKRAMRHGPSTKELNMSTETLLTTPLHALHLELGAKMVPFAGYDMPVQYPAGVMKEHLHTRAQA